MKWRCHSLSALILIAFLGGTVPCPAAMEPMQLTHDSASHSWAVFKPNSNDIIACLKEDGLGRDQVDQIWYSSTEISCTSDDTTHDSLSWDPSGNYMLTCQQGQIHMIKPDGFLSWSNTALTSSLYAHLCPVRCPSSDPSMDKIMCYRYSGLTDFDLVWYDISDGTETLMTNDSYIDAHPSWGSSGTTWVWTKQDATGYDQVYVQSLSAPATQATSDATTHRGPKFSPDEKALVYTEHRQVGEFSCRIVRMDWNGSPGTKVYLTDASSTSENAEWSPDGQWIVYDKDALCKVPSDGGTEVQLTDSDLAYSHGQWSSDGKWIVCDGLDGNIYKVAANQSPSSTLGWVRGEGDGMAGLLLYGNKVTQGLAGIPAQASAGTRHVLGHFASDTSWYTGIVIANTGGDPTDISVDAYDANGKFLAGKAFQLAGYGKISQLISSFFTSVQGTGWLDVTSSDNDIVVFDLYGNKITGGIASLPPCSLGSEHVISHYAANTAWWSGISIVNPNSSSVQYSIFAYDASGTLQGSYGPAALNGHCKATGYVEKFIAACAGKTGWIKVSATGDVGCLLVYGTKTSSPAEVGALTGVPTADAAKTLRFSYYRQQDPTLWTGTWWTGVAIVNPGLTTANLTLTAYQSEGTQIASASTALGPGCKLVNMVSKLLPAAVNTQGWINVQSDVALCGLEIVNADDSALQCWGVAAIESQEDALTMHYPHCDVSSSWWTFLSFVNPSATSDATRHLWGHATNGSVVASKGQGTLAPHAGVWGQVKDLLGMP